MGLRAARTLARMTGNRKPAISPVQSEIRTAVRWTARVLFVIGLAWLAYKVGSVLALD